MQDPRPDLKEDSEFWNYILLTAMIINEELAYILHGFRCSGLRVKLAGNKLVLRPEFNANSLWDNQADYDRDKQQYLVKFSKEIIEILNRVGGKQ